MISGVQQNWGKTLGGLLVILGGMGAIALLQMPQIERIRTRSETASVEEIRRDLTADKARLNILKRAPSFGFQNLIADWTFLNFLQYFGDTEVRAKSDYTLSPDYFEVILGHDPYFLTAYFFLSNSTSLYAGLPERSVAIAGQSLKHLTPTLPENSFYAWRIRAIDELLFLGDAQAARRSFETAANWAKNSGAVGSEAIAASSQQTAQFLATNPNSKFAQIASWATVLSTAPDDRTRRIAINRIEWLGGKVVPNGDGTYSIQPPAQD